MTQDEIIRMAREVWGERAILPFNELERFFNLAFTAGAAHEREQIAEVLDGIGAVYETEGLNGTKSYNGCAAAIRARNKKC